LGGGGGSGGPQNQKHEKKKIKILKDMEQKNLEFDYN
jgi:hypothetical protein